jgi:hypothetical protein
MFEHLGRNQEAKKAYHSARDAAQDELAATLETPTLAYSLALVCAFLGDSRQAEAEASQALAMEPENAIVIREAPSCTKSCFNERTRFECVRHASKRLLLKRVEPPARCKGTAKRSALSRIAPNPSHPLRIERKH